MAENAYTGTTSLAFNVLGAYGYPAGGGRGRVWALQASYRARQSDWEEFLRSLDLDVPPKLVITDGDTTIASAVRAVWPLTPGPSLPLPSLARCEHHLRLNGVQAMAEDGITGWSSWLRRRLDTHFDAPKLGMSW